LPFFLIADNSSYPQIQQTLLDSFCFFIEASYGQKLNNAFGDFYNTFRK